MASIAPYTQSFTTSLFLQSGIYHLVRRVETRIATVVHRIHLRQRRRKFLELLKYSDRMLSDMGLTRAAIERAATLPLHENAATSAREFARQDCLENQTFWHASRVSGPSGPDRYIAVPGLFPLSR